MPNDEEVIRLTALDRALAFCKDNKGVSYTNETQVTAVAKTFLNFITEGSK